MRRACPYFCPMTRRAPVLHRLPALLAGALLALAVGPAASAAAGALDDCCPPRCPMSETAPSGPGDLAECCVQAPATPADDAIVPAPPTHGGALVGALEGTWALRGRGHAVHRPARVPPLRRRHLALSVLRV